MKILGLETSTAVCSAGLFRDGMPVVEMSLLESHIHSEKLLTLVEQVVRGGSITLADLDAIAVSIGPGSFTGLRIGLSTAKGLSYALGKPLISVPTFDAIAEAAGEMHPAITELIIMVDAKKEEWYIGGFKTVSGRAVESIPVELRSTVDAVATVKGSRTSLVLTDRVIDIKRLVGEEVKVEDVHSYCRGGMVAAKACEKVLRKEFSDIASLEPMYLKDFFIRPASRHSSLPVQ